MKRQRIALFHPWIKSRGGAERVILELLENSSYDFDVYTWAYDKENTFKEFEGYKINVIAPRFGKKLMRLHLLRGLFFPISLFRKIPLEKYDKFLISTSGLAEFITFKNYKKGATYAYVHTPLREASKKIIEWNKEEKYKGKPFRKLIYLASVKLYKIFEKRAWKKLDVVIFNSELSESRAREDFLIGEQKTHVVYPPIKIPKYKKSKKDNQDKYFIYTSRLNPPKRQDLLIEAWKEFSRTNKGYKLKLVGTVDNKKFHNKLLELIGNDSSIEIKLNESDESVKELLENSIGGIFLGYQEDFGIVPLEVLAANKPLLAVDEGGYVKVIGNHPLFHRIKERGSKKEMILEISKELGRFIKKKQYKGLRKIKLKNFTKEIDKILK